MARPAIAGDITAQADCERIVAETVKRFGRLDVLVNNAGKGPSCWKPPRAPDR